MKMVRSILVITPGYPFEGEPVYPFVKNLCDEFARKGVNVMVLAPQSITSRFKHKKAKRPVVGWDETGDIRVMVYRPYVISLPDRFQVFNNWVKQQCVKRFIRKNHIHPNICYGHFWRSGYIALPIVKKYSLPLFVATGEGELRRHAKVLSTPQYMEINKYLNGAVSVSSNNKNISQEIGLLKGKDCLVAPNAIDSGLFYIRDRKALREHYGIAQDVFIVAFVGAFNERKGPHRVADAISKVGGVNSFFIGGQGESELQDPNCDGILFKGRLPHDTIPEYLCMADVFVLPTLNEGCCNAIVEALACGLPVVSSNRPFNFDVLDNTNSIMVDPTNVDEIAEAIKELRDNPEMRLRLAEGAAKMAESLTIDRRAEKILQFIEEHI